MHIIVSGKHLDLGEALQNYAIEGVQKSLNKYFPQAIKVHIIISKYLEEFHTNITVNEAGHHTIKLHSEGIDRDAHKSFDKAIKKLEVQLIKYKDLIKNHHKAKFHDLPAQKFILEDIPAQIGEFAPTIVAERPLDIKVLSVKEAVMHKDLQNLSAMIFINAANYKLSLIYTREDGNLGWVESQIDMTNSLNKIED
jgi:ribosomal subunit interface protein